jgi:hypothetical protein
MTYRICIASLLSAACFIASDASAVLPSLQTARPKACAFKCEWRGPATCEGYIQDVICRRSRYAHCRTVDMDIGDTRIEVECSNIEPLPPEPDEPHT